MKALLFDRLEIGWGELRPDHAWRPADYFAPLLENPRKIKLRTFPAVGQLGGSNTTDIVVSGEGLRFPSFGDWYIWCQLGVWKLHLRDRSVTAEDDVLRLSAFVASNICHSLADYHLATSLHMWPLDFCRAWEKLFYSDQPVAFQCGQIAPLLSLVLHHAGYVSRPIWFKNAKGKTHFVTEVWLPKEGRWIFIDADFGYVFRSGRLLSFEEICSGTPVTLEVFSQKRMQTDYNMGLGFVGQLTWRAEHMVENTPEEAQRLRAYYVSNVLGDVKVVEAKQTVYTEIDIDRVHTKRPWEMIPVLARAGT